MMSLSGRMQTMFCNLFLFISLLCDVLIRMMLFWSTCWDIGMVVTSSWSLLWMLILRQLFLGAKKEGIGPYHRPTSARQLARNGLACQAPMVHCFSFMDWILLFLIRWKLGEDNFYGQVWPRFFEIFRWFGFWVFFTSSELFFSSIFDQNSLFFWFLLMREIWKCKKNIQIL